MFRQMCMVQTSAHFNEQKLARFWCEHLLLKARLNLAALSMLHMRCSKITLHPLQLSSACLLRDLRKPCCSEHPSGRHKLSCNSRHGVVS